MLQFSKLDCLLWLGKLLMVCRISVAFIVMIAGWAIADQKFWVGLSPIQNMQLQLCARHLIVLMGLEVCSVRMLCSENAGVFQSWVMKQESCFQHLLLNVDQLWVMDYWRIMRTTACVKHNLLSYISQERIGVNVWVLGKKDAKVDPSWSLQHHQFWNASYIRTSPLPRSSQCRCHKKRYSRLEVRLLAHVILPNITRHSISQPDH